MWGWGVYSIYTPSPALFTHAAYTHQTPHNMARLVLTSMALLEWLYFLLPRRLQTIVSHAATEYRAYLVTLLVLPLSKLFDLYMSARLRAVMWLHSAPKAHTQSVDAVRRQILEWQADQKAGKRQQMCTARPGWMNMSLRVPKYKATHKNVELAMYDILSLDERRRTVTVEPNVTTGQVSEMLTPLGWTLPIVPELDDLTIGGLVSGFGVETTSHKYGLFQEICTAFEIILPDGAVERCSKDSNAELYHAVPWSHGTLGFLLSIEVQIVPAKKYVRLTYHPCSTESTAIELFAAASTAREPDEFVEALWYSDNEAVVMRGNMTDHCPDDAKINAIGAFYKPWFYTHVESMLRECGGSNSPLVREEYIPLRDYYHRHSKAIFWEMKDIIPFGNSAWFRYTLGWLIPPKVSFLKLTQTEAIRRSYEDEHVVQDMLVPLSKLKEALACFRREFSVFPLWLCPMKVVRHGNHRTFINTANESLVSEMFVDIGAYGVPKVPKFNAQRALRQVEKFVREVKGMQALYADTHMTRDEFREMFDHELYEKMRAKYNCAAAFPDVFDKVGKHARH